MEVAGAGGLAEAAPRPHWRRAAPLPLGARLAWGAAPLLQLVWGLAGAAPPLWAGHPASLGLGESCSSTPASAGLEAAAPSQHGWAK